MSSNSLQLLVCKAQGSVRSTTHSRQAKRLCHSQLFNPRNSASNAEAIQLSRVLQSNRSIQLAEPSKYVLSKPNSPAYQLKSKIIRRLKISSENITKPYSSAQISPKRKSLTKPSSKPILCKKKSSGDSINTIKPNSSLKQNKAKNGVHSTIGKAKDKQNYCPNAGIKVESPIDRRLEGVAWIFRTSAEGQLTRRTAHQASTLFNFLQQRGKSGGHLQLAAKCLEKTLKKVKECPSHIVLRKIAKFQNFRLSLPSTQIVTVLSQLEYLIAEWDSFKSTQRRLQGLSRLCDSSKFSNQILKDLKDLNDTVVLMGLQQDPYRLAASCFYLCMRAGFLREIDPQSEPWAKVEELHKKGLNVLFSDTLNINLIFKEFFYRTYQLDLGSMVSSTLAVSSLCWSCFHSAAFKGTKLDTFKRQFDGCEIMCCRAEMFAGLKRLKGRNQLTVNPTQSVRFG